MNRATETGRTGRSGARICGLCGTGFASIHAEVIGGTEIFACEECLEKAARHNFIWLCLQCRKVYLKPKKLVIEQIGDMELRAWYLRCMNDRLVQGIDRCAVCESQEAVLSDLASV